MAPVHEDGPAGVTDHRLVARVRRGDERAFELLYQRYQRRIHAYALGMVKDHGRAEDVTQEVFVSALRRMRATERPIAFKPWVYEIAKNACIDAFRRARRTEEVSYDAEDALTPGDHSRLVGSSPTPDAAVAAKQELESLWGAFGGLSQTHHEILVLRELEGLSYAEIGRRMGMSHAAVESTLFRARRRLTEEYDDIVSGARCRRVQSTIQLAARSRLGARDTRRLARHLAHCQLCRREALEAGLDRRLLARPAARERLASRVAALLPFPALARFRPGGGLRPATGGATGPHLPAYDGGPPSGHDGAVHRLAAAPASASGTGGEGAVRPVAGAAWRAPASGRDPEGAVRPVAGAAWRAPASGRDPGLLSQLPLLSHQLSGGWGKLATGGALLIAGLGAGAGGHHAAAAPNRPAAAARPALTAERTSPTMSRNAYWLRSAAAARPASTSPSSKPAARRTASGTSRRRASTTTAPSAAAATGRGTVESMVRHTRQAAGGTVQRTTSNVGGTVRQATSIVGGTVRAATATVAGTAQRASGTVAGTAQRASGTVAGTAQRASGTLNGAVEPATGTLRQVAGGGPPAGAVQQATGAVQQAAGGATGTIRQASGGTTATASEAGGATTGAVRQATQVSTAAAGALPGAVTGG